MWYGCKLIKNTNNHGQIEDCAKTEDYVILKGKKRQMTKEEKCSLGKQGDKKK